MSVELVTKFAPYTDELFKAESKISLLTNTDYDWTGAHTVKVWKVSTVPMQNYARNRGASDFEVSNSAASISRYGNLVDLDAQTEEMMLKNDRSFIFNVDKLDQDESANQLEAGKALARELRDVVIPEVDKYVYQAIVDGAGTVDNKTYTPENIYDEILTGGAVLDDAEVPETDRVLVVTPDVYKYLKQSSIFDHSDVGAEKRTLGVVGMLDGTAVVKVPASRLPQGVQFILAHPSATVAPVKLEDYGTHEDTPLSSGTIVTGRICYDAFVLDNKKDGIYVKKAAEV
jgi:hypothetical protein